MAEFLPPSMPEPRPDVPPAPGSIARPSDVAPQPSSPQMPQQPPPARRRSKKGLGATPGALGRLISLIVSVGLAWALTLAITAWLLGLFLSRG